MVLVILVLLTVNLALVQSQFLPLEDPTCSFFSSVSGSNFYAVPTNTLSQVCPSGSGKSCCTPEYQSTLSGSGNFSDKILSNILPLSNTSTTCQDMLLKLACAPCKDDSFVWSRNISASQFKLDICSSFCDRFLNACTFAVVDTVGQTLQHLYSSGESLCYGLFTNIQIIVNVQPVSSRGCFDTDIPPCTKDDIVYSYGECANNVRNLEFNWKPRTNCTGGVKLPASLSLLPCPISCQAGWYLPLGGTTCQVCPAGSFSLGGGYRIQNWNQWPTRGLTFDTYCTQVVDFTRLNASVCSGWVLNGTFIDSNIAGRPATRSVLTTTVHLLQNGTLKFLAKVDGEAHYDQLVLYIDANPTSSVVTPPASGVVTVIPNTQTPTLYQYPLAAGFHTIYWIYQKDISLNIGADKAIIYSIEVTSMALHNDYCTLCTPGYFSAEGATDCKICPQNQISNMSGAAGCINCSSDEYAYSGDSVCTKRKDCTTEDMQYLWTECGTTHTRSKIWSWSEPQICLPTPQVVLPPPELDQPCAPCNPGTYRDVSECKSCPLGKWSSIGSETCTPCGVGSYAPLSLIVNQWDTWPTNTTTRCTGDCGTTGWRLRSTHADSGVDHGNSVDATLVIPVKLETAGSVTFDYRLECSSWCYLEFWDNSVFMSAYWSSASSNNGTAMPSSKVFSLAAGAHNLTWLFGKFFSQRNADKALLDNVVVEGLESGGAGRCILCPNGTFSTGSVSRCTECPPGNYSLGGTGSCEACSRNTYQDKPGQSKCLPCGHDTDSTPPGSAKCTVQCSYRPPNTNITFDLSPLSRSDGTLWGPYSEGTLLYFVNPCPLYSNNADNSSIVCANPDGTPLNAPTCVYDGITSVSTDIGQVIGFYYSTDIKGFTVSFTGGTPGCGNEVLHRDDVPRSLNLTMICDPYAGIGLIQTPPNSTVSGNPNNCTYNLIWPSIYGCPLCTEDDYEMFTESCREGKQITRYNWKTNPKSCHHGISLPAPIIVECFVSTECPEGTKLVGGSCVPCPPGQFSIGNGEVISNWTEYLTPDNARGWQHSENYRGLIAVSEKCVSTSCRLRIVKDFQSALEPSIEFEYFLVGAIDRTQSTYFNFYIDNTIRISISNFSLELNKFYSFVEFGVHEFIWEHGSTAIQGSTSPPRTPLATISNLQFYGTVSAVTECNTCPTGEISNDERVSCQYCPLNTYIQVSSACGPCGVDEYRLVGSQSKICIPRDTCTLQNNYIESYPTTSVIDAVLRCGSPLATPENIAARNLSTNYVQLQPSVCKGNPEGISGKPITQCIPCPTGYIYAVELSKCIVCGAGTYLDSTTKQCKNIQSGYTSIRQIRFFHSDTDERNSDYVTSGGFPSGFFTSCRGSCSTTGWRMRGTSIDSGYNEGQIESKLQLDFNVDAQNEISEPPSVTFTVTYVPPSGEDSTSTNRGGLQLLIDSELQDIPYYLVAHKNYTFTFNITHRSDTHSIQWVYSQDSVTDLPGSVVLRDLTLVGTTNGFSSAEFPCPKGTRSVNSKCITCPPGTYSSSPASGACTPCDGNSVAPNSGSPSCTPCSPGTVKKNNICSPTCIFTVDSNSSNITFDLGPFKESSFVTQDRVENPTTVFELSPCSLIYAEHCRYLECKASSYIFGRFLKDDTTSFNPRSLGTTLQFVPAQQIPDKEGAHAFDLIYTQSNNPPRGCNIVTTAISFYCNITATQGTPQLISWLQSAQGDCTASFRWHAARACPVCRRSDVFATKGTCTNGIQQTTYSYQRMNAASQEGSQAKITPCFSAVPPPVPTQEPCEEVSLGVVPLVSIVASSLIVFAVAVGIAIHFYRQRREVEIRYERLKPVVTQDEDL